MEQRDIAHRHAVKKRDKMRLLKSRGVWDEKLTRMLGVLFRYMSMKNFVSNWNSKPGS